MPLVICVIFFIILFTGEAFWHLANVSIAEQQLSRYRAVEFPRRQRPDSYLDVF